MRLNYVELRRLFFGVCIPVRVLIGFLYYVVGKEAVDCGEECLPGYLVLRWLLGLSSLVFVGYSFYVDCQDNERGFFGGLLWWKNVRIIHMFNYFAAAVFLFSNAKGGEYFIFADAAIAVVYALGRRVFIFYV